MAASVGENHALRPTSGIRMRFLDRGGPFHPAGIADDLGRIAVAFERPGEGCGANSPRPEPSPIAPFIMQHVGGDHVSCDVVTTDKDLTRQI
jgi:hypothetical protein